ncbi:hypothetical protein Nepgr_017976 [Nepenthes gracilis]|uniref:Uncharacterized protein n=1 Tax=Nepenthes gracilis TaxID=150966 RepID=A0AAD3SSG6_NEPGR|nr:hypothetical protein Nepgr_017976 [Nepenthes gracilis]
MLLGNSLLVPGCSPKVVSGLADMLLILSSGKQLLDEVKCGSYSLWLCCELGVEISAALLMEAAAGNAETGSWWLADAGSEVYWILLQ